MSKTRSTAAVALLGLAAVIACGGDGDGGASVIRQDVDTTTNPIQDPPVRFPDIPAPTCDNPTWVRQGEIDVPVCDGNRLGGSGGTDGAGGTGGTDGIGGNAGEGSGGQGGTGGTTDEPPPQPDAGPPDGGEGGSGGAGGSAGEDCPE